MDETSSRTEDGSVLEYYPKLEFIDEKLIKQLVEDTVDWAHVSVNVYLLVSPFFLIFSFHLHFIQFTRDERLVFFFVKYKLRIRTKKRRLKRRDLNLINIRTMI